MKYQDIINSHIKYGISKDSIIENRGYKDILENVVIAPWWGMICLMANLTRSIK